MADVSGKRSLGQRENQEDAFAILAQSEEDASGDLLMVVSDGMGGHVGGEVASNLVLTTFQEHFVSGSTAHNPRDRLLESAHAANTAIRARIKADPSLKGMGCTLVAGLKINDKLIWVSIGDSHVYLYRGGELRHLNADHSVFGELLELVKAGKLTLAEAKANPRRNALRSAIIGTELTLIDLNAVELQHGDLIVLATDGLDSLPNDKVSALLAGAARADAKTIAEQLLVGVKDVGRSNQDNTTVVVYRHSETNRSTWSPDSKWGWHSGAKSGISPNVRNAAILIGGLCLVALVVGTFALRSLPDPTPSPKTVAPTEQQLPRDEAIGGGEATTLQPTDGDVTEPENGVEGGAKNGADTEGRIEDNIEDGTKDTSEVVPDGSSTSTDQDANTPADSDL